MALRAHVAPWHPSPAPALGSRFRSENAREHTAQFPSPTGFATTCPAPAISQTAKCAQAPGVRAGSSLGPQCSGRHSFRSLDSFSLGIAVHHGCRFGAATIVHPQALTAVLRAPLCCIVSLLSSPRVRSGAMWCLHQSNRTGRARGGAQDSNHSPAAPRHGPEASLRNVLHVDLFGDASTPGASGSVLFSAGILGNVTH